MGIEIQQGQAAAAGASMTLLGTLTTTSGTTQSLTGIAAGYRELYCEIDGVSASSSWQLSVALSSTNGAAYGTAVVLQSAFVTAGSTINGTLRIGNISSTIAAAKAWEMITGDTPVSVPQGAISTNTAAVVDAIRFACNGGNFDAGSIRIYGVK